MIYPIAECFVAPQGEGSHAGKLMSFIRFAGCTVGKPFPKERYEERYSADTDERPLHLPIYIEQCTTYDGRKFACDTDFRVKERLTEVDLLQWALYNNGEADVVPIVLLTGGEPLMHNLEPLLELLATHGFAVHVETSGTIVPSIAVASGFDWVCCSPKFGFQDAFDNIVDEYKLLVDENFDWEKVPPIIRSNEEKICLSPINFEHTLDPTHIDKCLEIQRKYPGVRITIQQHKVLGTR